ncbi:hypothetical protein BCV70DRAFT_199968 [Testicularia cyperi]|uniref:Uncharacterized protein n=1 Tax=Testicularia cyperi TaxID=1882483 RepID=A0A317XS52_9BASI|nr:hypothetical protein BCV70DRAFT_199968 [Testicularia cyperi]
MIRRPPTSLSVQESDVEALKAYRRQRMMQQNPNLTSSSFSSIRPDDSGSVHEHPHPQQHQHQHQQQQHPQSHLSNRLHPGHHHHHHHNHHHHTHGQHRHGDEPEDLATQPGLSQQENHNPNQSSENNGAT